ncbi:MAG: TSUP family transporter [Desulfomonilaceae bacterium]
MIEYAVICTVAIVVSALTLFSGFGLGTLLMPAFALFFPINVAVAATAVVHLVNNLFKVVLVGKHANIKVVIRFALPAAIFAALGALVLGYMSEMEPLVRYNLGGRSFEITTIKLVIAVLIAIFSFLDLLPRFQDLAFDEKYIPLGGILSGFFGGLSGLQGALRSAFLIRAGLDKDQFIGTGVVSAVVVDVSRLAIYGATFFSKHFTTLGGHGESGLIVAGILSAWLGSFIGVRLLRKITIKTLQVIVGGMLLVLSVALGIGAI